MIQVKPRVQSSQFTILPCLGEKYVICCKSETKDSKGKHYCNAKRIKNIYIFTVAHVLLLYERERERERGTTGIDKKNLYFIRGV